MWPNTSIFSFDGNRIILEIVLKYLHLLKNDIKTDNVGRIRQSLRSEFLFHLSYLISAFRQNHFAIIFCSFKKVNDYTGLGCPRPFIKLEVELKIVRRTRLSQLPSISTPSKANHSQQASKKFATVHRTAVNSTLLGLYSIKVRH